MGTFDLAVFRVNWGHSVQLSHNRLQLETVVLRVTANEIWNPGILVEHVMSTFECQCVGYIQSLTYIRLQISSWDYYYYYYY